MAVSQLGAPISFSSGNTIVSADVNSNFSDIRTAFNALVTASDQLAGGLTINGDLYISSGLGLTQFAIGGLASGGSTNDWNISGKSYVEATVASAGTHTITGISAGDDGQLLVITVAGGGGTLAIKHQDSASSAANRIYTIGTVATHNITDAAPAGFIYSPDRALWIHVF